MIPRGAKIWLALFIGTWSLVGTLIFLVLAIVLTPSVGYFITALFCFFIFIICADTIKEVWDQDGRQ